MLVSNSGTQTTLLPLCIKLLTRQVSPHPTQKNISTVWNRESTFECDKQSKGNKRKKIDVSIQTENIHLIKCDKHTVNLFD